MNIERALRIKRGERVACPPDRGDKGYMGEVVHTSPIIATNRDGTEYIWIQVQHPDGHKSVWPSNRLGTTMGELREACVA